MQNTIALPPKQWVTLTASAVAAIRIENRGLGDVYLDGTATSAPPTDIVGTVILRNQETLYADMTLAHLFPDPGGSMFVHAYTESGFGAVLSVAHA